MEKITKYVAFDGEEFEYEEECLDYERKEKTRNCYGFQAYDRMAREIHPTDYDDLDDFVTDMGYLKITDVKGRDEFVNICDDNRVYLYDGMEDFCEKGLYYFDEDKDYWYNWDFEYEKLRIIRRKMDY